LKRDAEFVVTLALIFFFYEIWQTELAAMRKIILQSMVEIAMGQNSIHFTKFNRT
jgi:hypothetical protein